MTPKQVRMLVRLCGGNGLATHERTEYLPITGRTIVIVVGIRTQQLVVYVLMRTIQDGDEISRKLGIAD